MSMACLKDFIKSIVLILTLGSLTTFCKKSSNEAEQTGLPSTKPSEEPLGLPGYSMDCKFEAVPNTTSPILLADCLLEEPVETAAVDVEDKTQSTVQTSSIGLPGGVRLDLRGKTPEEILAELNNVILKISNQGKELAKTTVAEIIATEADRFRFDSSCIDLFTIMKTNQLSSNTIQATKFPDCEKLSSFLSGIESPGLPTAVPQSTNGIVTASCSPDTLTIAISNGGISTSFPITPISDRACAEFRDYINTLGF